MSAQDMPMQPVDSSAIVAIGHDGNQTLRVQFRSGKSYDYARVSPEEFTAFLAAESKGRHLVALLARAARALAETTEEETV